MTLSFTHDTLGQRVVFAPGEVVGAVLAELARYGASRPLVVAGDSQRSIAESVLVQVPGATPYTEVVMHVPVEVAERARAATASAEADLVLSIGGGSATGLAKAVALTSGLPVVSVPTTYAGSEATDVWGLTHDGRKTTGTDPRVLPRTVVYDATLTLGLPVDLSVASGLNAVAHCVDALWAPRADPINATLAEEGIRALALALPLVVADPGGLSGREQSLYGAYVSAVAFGSAGSGLHHKICHVLGGMFDLPHAQTHAVVLPHVLAFNGPSAPAATERVARALGSEAVVGLAALPALVELVDRLDAPRSLCELGMPHDGIPRALAAVLAAVPAGNPRPVTAADLEQLLEDAWEGTRP